MVNREIRSSGTTWTGMTLHTLFTTSGKEGQMHLPFKAQDAAQKKGPIKCGGFCHLCGRAKSLGCR